MPQSPPTTPSLAGGESSPPVALALDTASPIVSVAVAGPVRVLGQREIELAHSSEHLLRLIDEVLRQAGLELSHLHGMAILRGPGSFTGLRVGLATALAIHQALDLPVTAPSTLQVLAASVRGDPVAGSERVVAAVDALRGEWVVQEFRPGALQAARLPTALTEAERLPPTVLAELPSCRLVGFGITAARGASRSGVCLEEPGPLAPIAARLAAADAWSWDATLLTRPLYFRPPAVGRP